MFALAAVLAGLAVACLVYWVSRAVPPITAPDAESKWTPPITAPSAPFPATATSSFPAHAARSETGGTGPVHGEESLRGNVVVSLGKVEDIGREIGYIAPLLAEMRTLAAVGNAKLAPEQRRRLLDLQRRYAGMLGLLPVIAGFQNNPAEYGKFFAQMAKQSAGLSQSQADNVDLYMRGRANEMIQAGLNEAVKPADPAQMDAWEARRDGFNEQTVEGLRQVLSPQVADRAGINEQMMELLETDFDRAGRQPGLD